MTMPYGVTTWRPADDEPKYVCPPPPVGEARLRAALAKIEISAEAGLCYFTLESAREFLKDIRDEVADALGTARPRR